MGLILRTGTSPEVGNGNLLQYFCLQNPVDRGAWWAAVHRVTQELDMTEATQQQQQQQQQPLIYSEKSECFWRQAFKEVLELKWGCWDGPSSNLSGILKRRGNLHTRRDTRHVSTKKGPCKDTARRFSSVQFSLSVVSNSLQPHESQHARPPCPSPLEVGSIITPLHR